MITGRLGAFLASATLVLAAFPSLENLYTRPYVWGTPPDNLTWARNAEVLFFTWNSAGNRFRDLYAWHAAAKKLVRLTDLESVQDSITATEAEKDPRRRNYLAPQEGITDYSVSHDGKRAAFSLRGDLFIADSSGSDPLRLTKTSATESMPRISPDGASLASIRGGQIVVQNLANGQIWQITELEGASVTGYQWSPDSASIAYIAEQGPSRRIPLPNYSGRFVTAATFSRTVAGDEPQDWKLYVAPAESGPARELETGISGKTWLEEELEWSNDSAAILLEATHADMKKRDIVVIPVKSGKGKVVAEEKDPKWADRGYAGFSPDGEHVLFTSERDRWSHLYTVASTGGEAKQLTRGAWEIIRDTFAQDPQWIGNSIYYASTEEGPSERHFYRIRPDGSGKEKLSTQAGLNIGLASRTGKNIAWRLADLENPFDLWVGGTRVTQSPQPDFYKIDWPQTVFVEFPARADGKTVHAKMLLPAGYSLESKGRQWPAVFFIHGAGYATSVLKQWGSYNDLRFVYNCYLARQGYVVIDIDYRGSSGYGRDWRTDVYLHMGGPDLEDVLGGVDFLRKTGNIDMKRIGIWGVSYGGFMTNMALFLSPGTFRAGSSWASVNDWANYNAFYTRQRLGTPQSNPEAYRRSSPIYFSGQLEDKLLIVHGMVDNNVLFQDAVQLTQKLIQEGKDFAHIYYPEESHGFVRDETWIDALRRTTEWFERYLK